MESSVEVKKSSYQSKSDNCIKISLDVPTPHSAQDSLPQQQEDKGIVLSQKKTIAVLIIIILLFLLLVASIIINIYQFKQPRVAVVSSDLQHIQGIHPDNCQGTLYTIPLQFSKGPFVLNVTDVPECFIQANPQLNHTSTNGTMLSPPARLLQGEIVAWLFYQFMGAFIQAGVNNAFKLQEYPTVPVLLLAALLLLKD